jgi:hypothetical protein
LSWRASDPFYFPGKFRMPAQEGQTVVDLGDAGQTPISTARQGEDPGGSRDQPRRPWGRVAVWNQARRLPLMRHEVSQRPVKSAAVAALGRTLPTLQFSVPGQGWSLNARKIRKWLWSAIFRALVSARSSRKFLNIPGTSAHDYTGCSRRSRIIAPAHLTCRLCPHGDPDGLACWQSVSREPVPAGIVRIFKRQPRLDGNLSAPVKIAPTGDVAACPRSPSGRDMRPARRSAPLG